MGKIASFWKILSRDIYVGRRLKNNLIALTIVSIFTTILGSVLVILDLVTKNYSMLVPAGVTLLGGLSSALVAGVFKKRNIAIWIPVFFCSVAFIYYSITGASNGTAIYWSLLMPIGICYFVSVKVGFFMSFFYSIFFCVLFYSPLNQFIKDYYPQDIMVRFPMIFIAMAGFTLISMLQYHRVALIEIDYQKKLKEEVEVQTKYATDRAKRLENITDEIVKTLASVIDAKDKYTNGHSFRVALYSCALAKKLNFTENAIHELRWEGLLHDIGKIGIPDSVLNKPGKLTEEEFDLMKKHAAGGGKVVRDLLMGVTDDEYIAFASDIATYHHERYDGKGYPRGLRGREIPLSARIMAIADVFDALTSKRCYKDALSFDEAIKIIKEESGTHFDPLLVEVFLNHKEEFKL